ncbi:MAG: dTDP-4-dehydrorhamnose 3,5-epimerase [Gemmatimonadaceae bacterium]
MKVETTGLPGVLLISPTLRTDSRGSFHEVWQEMRYREAGLPVSWAQDNVSRSRRGVLRGLHFQHPRGQGKLVSVLAGEILDVAVDIRVGSPSFGHSVAEVLDAATARQLYVPAGFAHGFAVLSDEAVVHYKCTEYHAPEFERIVAWNDPSLHIDWRVHRPILSPKDSAGRTLSDFATHELPRYESST